MTTKLIQELVGLCVEKNQKSDTIKREIELTISDVDLVLTIYNTIESTYYRRRFTLDTSNTENQLQGAIEKVKQL